MVMPLFASLEKIPRSLIEASMDLGVGRLGTFLRVTLPLSVPGILAGFTFTFCLSAGDFISPSSSAAWGLQNRSCAIRVSSPDRFEFRAVDSMVNPYLMQAALLKAFDDGIERKLDPGSPEERNVAEVVASGEAMARVPSNLAEALDALAEDDVIRAALPGHLYTCYEWNRFCWQVSDWDVKTYLLSPLSAWKRRRLPEAYPWS